jgi:hypothetical protein
MLFVFDSAGDIKKGQPDRAALLNLLRLFIAL